MIPTDSELLELAREAAQHAYAPYSDFPVGAALLFSNGRVVTGCNVENASFGLTICAERTAVTRAIISGEANRSERPRIVAAAVVGLKAQPCYPCGACRQVLSEFSCERVIVAEHERAHSVPFSELLPYAFGPDSL